jgi:hypothetical protein
LVGVTVLHVLVMRNRVLIVVSGVVHFDVTVVVVAVSWISVARVFIVVVFAVSVIVTMIVAY